jgi:hypothetical protein
MYNLRQINAVNHFFIVVATDNLKGGKIYSSSQFQFVKLASLLQVCDETAHG